MMVGDDDVCSSQPLTGYVQENKKKTKRKMDFAKKLCRKEKNDAAFS